MSKLFLGGCLCLLIIQARAQKIYGGHFDRRNPIGALSGVPYAYRFACTFYTDAKGAAELPDQLTFRIIRKSDNTVVGQYTESKVLDTQASTIANNCGASAMAPGIEYFFVRYNHDMIVNPAFFNHNEGYYVVNDPVGVRNPTVNVASSAVVLYHWFSPQYLFEQLDNANDGKTASGWVPESYRYVCKGKSNAINLGVAMLPAQTIFNGQTFQLSLRSVVPVTEGGLPFKEVAWKSRFSSNNPGLGSINVSSGNLPFANNSSTAFFNLTVTPPQVGIYSVAFVTEQRRNGILLCINYREMQFEVNDCSLLNTKPIISVSKVGKPNTTAQTAVCQDSLVQLNVKSYAKGGVLQWKLNNTDIRNATDSVLVIRNNQTGVYTCAVYNEQLCPKNIISDPVTITLSPKPTVSVSQGSVTGTPCVDGFVKLTSNANGTGVLNYQWLRENKPIAGANTTTYDAVETGVYTLKVTDSNGCGNVSPNLPVISNTPPKAEIWSSKRGVCPGGTVTVFSTSGRTNIYLWMRNGQPIGGVKDSVIVSQSGTYSVKITAPNGCSTESQALAIIQYPDAVATIESPGNQLCAGATVPLSAKGIDLKKFEWLRNDQKISGATMAVWNAAQEGNYTVAVTDTNGCKVTSKAFEVKKVDKIRVTLDSIPNFCGTSTSTVSLSGTPAGGIYAGAGVTGNSFDPKSAGEGRHVITYTVKGNLDCLNGEAKREVTVAQPPMLQLGRERTIVKGTSVAVNAELGTNYTYQWTPEEGIDNPNVAKPVFTPERTTTYHVKATGPSACLTEDSLTIYVFSGVYIPDVFTPNGDGQNDTWELKGLEDYPEAEVTVFNRWGQAVFYEKGNTQKRFEGKANENVLPEGEYVYVIRTAPQGHVWRGRVLLMR